VQRAVRIERAAPGHPARPPQLQRTSPLERASPWLPATLPCTPPEYIRAPAEPAKQRSAEPYSPAVQHHSELSLSLSLSLSLYNTAVSPSVTPLALCRLIQVVYSQNSRLFVPHFLPPRPGKGLPRSRERPLTIGERASSVPSPSSQQLHVCARITGYTSH
jgi:hypothetical protein